MSSLRKKSLFLKVFLKLNNLEKYRFVSSKIKKISFESLEKIFSRLYISVSFDEKLCNCKREARPRKLVKSFLSVVRKKRRKEKVVQECPDVDFQRKKFLFLKLLFSRSANDFNIFSFPFSIKYILEN